MSSTCHTPRMASGDDLFGADQPCQSSSLIGTRPRTHQASQSSMVLVGPRLSMTTCHCRCRYCVQVRVSCDASLKARGMGGTRHGPRRGLTSGDDNRTSHVRGGGTASACMVTLSFFTGNPRGDLGRLRPHGRPPQPQGQPPRCAHIYTSVYYGPAQPVRRTVKAAMYRVPTVTSGPHSRGDGPQTHRTNERVTYSSSPPYRHLPMRRSIAFVRSSSRMRPSRVSFAHV